MTFKIILLILFILLTTYFGSIAYQKLTSKNITFKENMQLQELEQKVMRGELAKIVFAGGCFWCTEASFDPEYGVAGAISGYMGGSVVNPSYEEVSGGDTGAREAVLVYYNPASTTLRKLLVNYWTHIDPTQTDGQFADIGYQYTSAIYYFNDEQLRLASESKNIVATLFAKEDKTVATEILHGEGVPFYPAEEYHQDYSQKNPVRYEYYKNGSGRTPFQKTFWTTHKSIFDNFLHEQGTEAANSNNVGSWKNFTAEMKEENLKKLTELQYKVSQQEKTEPPFENAYDKNYEKGLYVDVVSGEPLFLSSDKFDSGTGWPSFVKPINDSALNLKTDYWLLYPRTEVRSRVADSHLGHVFDDGPTDRGGKRYCMNSAAMRFIPLSEMESLGYGEYIELVK